MKIWGKTMNQDKIEYMLYSPSQDAIYFTGYLSDIMEETTIHYHFCHEKDSDYNPRKKFQFLSEVENYWISEGYELYIKMKEPAGYLLVTWNWGEHKILYSDKKEAEIAYVDACTLATLNHFPEPKLFNLIEREYINESD